MTVHVYTYTIHTKDESNDCTSLTKNGAYILASATTQSEIDSKCSKQFNTKRKNYINCIVLMCNDTQYPTESGKISLKLKSKGAYAIASSKQPAQRNMNEDRRYGKHFIIYITKQFFSIR